MTHYSTVITPNFNTHPHTHRYPHTRPYSRRLVSAVFTNDGLSVVARFDSATNGPTLTTQSFPCNVLFSLLFEPMSNPNPSLCFWTSPSVLQLNPNPERNWKVGTLISLRSGVLKSSCSVASSNSAVSISDQLPIFSCSALSFAASQSVVLAPPSDPVYPTVSLSTAKVVSACEPLLIDPTGSAGLAGEFTWAVVSWTVSGGINARNISRYLNMIVKSNNNTLFEVVSVPSSFVYGCGFLYDGCTYTISLGLTNRFDRTSVASTVVTVTRLASPLRVSVFGPAVVNLFRWQVLKPTLTFH